ncbi:MAG: tetratricopeptide repeat protein [Methylococcales bacterium]|nr:tetratricopeptide repeat protein [Methylococcales bacterium]
MEIYDTEEEQVAAIKRWWKENGVSTIIGVAAGIVIIVGWNYWMNYTRDNNNQASALYVQLQESVASEKNEAVEKIVEQLKSKYAATAYASYASLLLAKTKVQQGDLEAAKTILEKLMRTAGSVELKHVARIRLIKLMLATDDNEKGLQLIAEVDQANSQGFSASYDELTGDLYLALDRLGEARTAYQTALRAGARLPLLQFKLDDLTAAEVVNNLAE